ncbi:DUF4129 domain-containing protein [Aureivirga marina]|uniref:DUF4129 domain-containing protein n=1 Tax=Aureivirga marina TaxID=1182451 RepID=UPI0018CA1B2A|nr:DUF4129 domain-containing protein [Aureivirga marina]
MFRKIFVLFCFCVSTIVFAQTTEDEIQEDRKSTVERKHFDANKLQGYKEKKDFNYEINEKDTSLYERIINWLTITVENFLHRIFENETAGIILGFIGLFFTYLPYLFGAIVLYLLLKFLNKKGYISLSFKSKNKKNITFSDDEKIINEADLPSLIEKAVLNQNFRLAIRYQYLFLLKQLQDAEILRWAQQKTNEDYFEEIEKEEIKQYFRKVTDLYDYIWYGNFNITEIEYNKLLVNFEKVTKTLNYNG